MRGHSSISGSAQRRPSRAFTLTDLLVALAALAVLAALIAVPVIQTQRKARLARCTANLAAVSGAILSFSADNNNTIPGPVAGQRGDSWWWYKELVKSHVRPVGDAPGGESAFACPDDRGFTDPKPFHQTARFDSNSYTLNAVTLPGIPNIAGWRVASVRAPARTLLVMEWTAHAPLSWHQSRTGKRNLPFYCDARSVVGFVDGHVRFTRIYYDGYNAAYTRDPIAGYEYKYSGN